jgi:chloramphenicol 3-O-phosphotransferase
VYSVKKLGGNEALSTMYLGISVVVEHGALLFMSFFRWHHELALCLINLESIAVIMFGNTSYSVEQTTKVHQGDAVNVEDDARVQ